jgi:hypothetical protein
MSQRRSNDLPAPREHSAPEPPEERTAENRGDHGGKTEKRNQRVSRHIEQLNDRKLPIPLDEGSQLAPAIEIEVAKSVRSVRRDDHDAGQQQEPRDV